MTDKIEVQKVPEKVVEVKKAPTKKPVAKKARARKVSVKKAAPKKSVFEQIEDSPIAVPFKMANKTFMAGLGMLSFVQKELDKKVNDFDKTFTKYAKDGEKVFDKWEDRVEDFRKDVEKKVDDTRDRVRDTFKKAA